MRFFILLALCALSSCAHRLEDENLTPEKVSPPSAFRTLDRQPRLEKWAEFHAYSRAAVEVAHLVEWNGERAIPGESLAIHLNEGSVLRNTTAHPQYFDIWIQIPASLAVEESYELRPAAARRRITRTRHWGPQPDAITIYSVLNEGEMTVAGMRGYDVPTLAKTRRSVATLTLLERGRDFIRFKLTGSLPILQDSDGVINKFRLNVDREYTANFKPVKNR